MSSLKEMFYRTNYGRCWHNVLKEGGVRAFYTGIAAEYCKVVPGMAIAFSTFEALKTALGVTA